MQIISIDEPRKICAILQHFLFHITLFYLALIIVSFGLFA